MEYGYARVSSLSQNLDRQIRELVKNGVKMENIFADKYSGKTIKRPGFQKLLKKVKSGDAIFITSFDRLGRNYDETVEVWNYLTKKKGVDLVVLDLPILDTREKACGEMGKFIQDLVVQILAYVADAERKKNREAQKGGIEAKKARGEWEEYGRPKKMELEKFEEAYVMLKQENKTQQEVIEELGISNSTYFRYKRRLNTGTDKC